MSLVTPLEAALGAAPGTGAGANRGSGEESQAWMNISGLALSSSVNLLVGFLTLKMFLRTTPIQG